MTIALGTALALLVLWWALRFLPAGAEGTLKTAEAGPDAQARVEAVEAQAQKLKAAKSEAAAKAAAEAEAQAAEEEAPAEEAPAEEAE